MIGFIAFNVKIYDIIKQKKLKLVSSLKFQDNIFYLFIYLLSVQCASVN